MYGEVCEGVGSDERGAGIVIDGLVPWSLMAVHNTARFLFHRRAIDNSRLGGIAENTVVV